MNAKKILIPLPSYGFDPTESAVPWKILKSRGFQITFATPAGKMAQADQRLVGDAHKFAFDLSQIGKDF